jgi:DNA modification methylase
VNLRRKEHRADHFSGPPDLEALVAGAKPVWLMQALVAAYSEPGDLVVDAYAGSGTTLIAASQMGRRSIGAEMDAGRYALAARRLRKGYTPDFFSAA